MDGVIRDERLEFTQAGVDEAGRGEMRRDGFRGLEAVASDADDDRFVLRDFAVFDQLLRAGEGDTTGGLGEDAFGFG